MDPIDRAHELEELHREQALSRHRNRRESSAVDAGRDCAECGEPIPAKRLAAHPAATRCIEHARLHEARLKHYRKD